MKLLIYVGSIALLTAGVIVVFGLDKPRSAHAEYMEFSFRPVYPTIAQNNQFGITMRDYIAVQAMNGLIVVGRSGPESVATRAYEYADAMIKARDAHLLDK